MGYQLNNGLYVSGAPEPPKEKRIMRSMSIPYTGGDIHKFGELGKMFNIPVEGSKHRKSRAVANFPSHSGPTSSSYSTSSGPLSKHGEPIRKHSDLRLGGAAPVLPVTGLITSGPISSGPLKSSGMPRKASGPLASSHSTRAQGSSVGTLQGATNVEKVDENSFKRNIPRSLVWGLFMFFSMGFMVGGFVLGSLKSPSVLIVVTALLFMLVVLCLWNMCWARNAVLGYITRRPDSELRTAANGEYVKVTGMVTCGSVPLTSSFQKIPRCVYTSTSLHEYRGSDTKAAAHHNHRRWTWGLRHSEKHAVDFYISDFQSGLRALVKSGYGSRVTPYVDETVAIEFDYANKESSSPPELTQWLADRNLSCDDRKMRLKEGYVKEGSTVSVMGVVRRVNNVLMIVPPSEPVAAKCQWTKCLFPPSLDGIVLRCEDTSDLDVIIV